jgi:hypothetical protein
MQSAFRGLMKRLDACIAALLFCGVVISVGLAAAPQLHDWLHKGSGASHECAATLMSNGSLEHSACDPVLKAPQPARVAPTFVTPGIRVIARAEASILEHAPPANS